jgi:DNA-binding transcriptional LysR family regulator
MELRHLRYFLVVAEELHFGRAAARLHITQPPLSQQIRQLEDELGVPLFQRTKRRVQLTDAGRAFWEAAQKMLDQAEQAVRTAQRVHRPGATQMLTVIGLVAAGMGLSLVPASMQTVRWKGIVYRPVQDRMPPADLTVAWRRDETSAVVKMFVGVVREMTRPR